MAEPRIERAWVLDAGPRPLQVEWHVEGCDCPACEPYVPSAPRPLGFVEIGMIAWWAIVAVHVVACVAWGPATVWHVLVANLTGARL